jgi:outer membrane protein OmpA-like peptidoglycan-associated protein
LLLFTTNLATIALSTTLMCTWYGFSGRATRHAVAWQIVVGFAVLLPLGWPLAHALGDIAQQTRLLGTVRNTLTGTLSNQSVRVLDMQIDDSRKVLDVTFAAQHYGMDENTALHQALRSALPSGLGLRLNPVITSDPTQTELGRSALSASIPGTVMQNAATPDDETSNIVGHFPLPLLSSGSNAQTKTLTLMLAPTSVASNATLRQMEDQLRTQLPGWTIQIVPPPRPLPPVLFERGSAQIGPTQQAALENTVWALQRWGVHDVAVEGRASTDGRGPVDLAEQRAAHVRQTLETAGLHVVTGASYPLPDQQRREVEEGVDPFRSVFVYVVDPGAD